MNNSGPSGQIPPVYEKLKGLHLRTELVKEGRPHVTIVVPVSGIYDAQASRIQEAIQKRSGVKVPVVKDDAPEAGVPIQGNLIVLGNRSTNRTIEELYNRYFTLLDLWYPGPGGYEVRTLHNPFGGGHNVIFVGGSDAAGVDRAVGVLVEKLGQAEGGKGALSVGWLMEIGLGKGRAPQKDLKDFRIWDGTVTGGHVGYFGWNSLSKRMAMYYMTGDPFHAREAIRLAFPDEKAKQEFTEIDGELIENKDDPIAGPYHYGAHMMILYWDLIEESPVFTDEERLRVTNAFSRQFAHPQEQAWRRRIPEEIPKGEAAYAEPPPHVSSRHGQWSSIALYCLGRYFERDYGDPLWRQSVASAKWQFSPFHRHAWVIGEIDNLGWYSTGMAQGLVYMLLTGDRKPLENGVTRRLIKGHEILASGWEQDPMHMPSSIAFHRQAAYLTQDGRWLEYLRRTGADLSAFHLGQSFAPGSDLPPAQPMDLVGMWSVHPLPAPMWRSRATDLPLEDSFMFGSFRSAPDASGDFLLVKGMNWTGRNPYHTFAVLNLRIDGQTVLDGYLNQVVTRADGMVEPKAAMDAALRRRDVVGQTAVAVGETPDAPFSCWRRTILQRIGRYALVVDRLAFRADSANMEAEILWEGKGTWEAKPGKVRVQESEFEIVLSDPVETRAGEGRARMAWHGAVKAGDERTFFSVIARTSPVCARLGENAAVLALPEPAIVVAGGYEGIEGELVVLAQDHLHGIGLKQALLGAGLLSADAPVDVDWDFETGILYVVTSRETRVEVAIEEGQTPPPKGEGREGVRGAGRTFTLPAGRHCLEGVRPDAGALKEISERLAALLSEARKKRDGQGARDKKKPSIPALNTVFTAETGGGLVDLVTVSSGAGQRVWAAGGEQVHVLGRDGKEVRRMATDGPIRVLRWWPEPRLLLAGCADEKVIAFDEAGERRWTFVSEMDPAVFQAAKQYWFKSAPGHEGVHGLHTGVFLDGKSQAFVGSACTLEILDEQGGLVKRLPVFWGPGVGYGIVEGPEGSLNLLIARHPTDMHTLAVVNNRKLDASPRSFYGVPAGYTNVSVWGCMYRRHVFVEDLDGDGKREVIGEIDGTWNRIGVWAEDGTPLYNVQLGPGAFRPPPRPCPERNVQDMDVADLNGDGKQEIVAALSGGLVLALDARCEKVWARRLPSPPTVVACVAGQGGTWVAVGCEDGTLVALDGRGEVVGMGRTQGRPTCIGALDGVAVTGTDAGEVKGWMIR